MNEIKKSYKIKLKPSAMLATLITLTAFSDMVFAQVVETPTQTYHLAAGPLKQTLIEIAQISKTPLSFDASVVGSAQAPAVEGKFTALDAVSHALKGTGLQVKSEKSGALIIEKATMTASNRTSDADGAVDVAQNQTALPAITVSDTATTQNTGFMATHTSSATRTDTPITDIPQTVQSITQDVMQSQQATTVEDVLSNVSGITVYDGEGISKSVYVRGFQAAVSIDGLNDGQGNDSGLTPSGFTVPLIGIQSIDVLKGADAILSGNMSPGGVVNVVRKQPQADPVHEVTVQVGSYGEALTSIDLAGALSLDKRLTYRFVAQVERKGNDYGISPSHNYYISPSIGYKTENTDLVIGFEQHSARDAISEYVAIADYAIQQILNPYSNKEDHILTNNTSANYDFKQKISENWSIESKGRYEANSYNFALNSGYLSDKFGDYYPYSEHQIYKMYNISLQENFKIKFNTGPLSHIVLAGFAFQRGNYDWAFKNQVGTISSIFSDTTTPEVASTLSPTYSATTLQHQVYVQDQIQLYNRLHVLASLTRSDDSYSELYKGVNDGNGGKQSAYSPNLGALYQLTGNLGIYANYQKSFKVQYFDVLATGGVAPPSIGRTVDIGTKYNIDDRLSGSIALFRSAATNIVYTNANYLTYVSPGGDVARGVEVDLSGEIMPGWKMIANYSYTTHKVADTALLAALPRHTFKLWSTYKFKNPEWSGLAVGLGLTGRTSYKTRDSSHPAFNIPAQVSMDASVSFHAKKWSTSFGIKNITNRHLYGTYGTWTYVSVPQPGRTFLLTTTYDF